MTLPYAPGQLATRFAEEDEADETSAPERLDGLPVVCLGLHSQLAPVCAALAGTTGRLRSAGGRIAARVALGHAAGPQGAAARGCGARGLAVPGRRPPVRHGRCRADAGGATRRRGRGLRDRARDRRDGVALGSRRPRRRGGGERRVRARSRSRSSRRGCRSPIRARAIAASRTTRARRSRCASARSRGLARRARAAGGRRRSSRSTRRVGSRVRAPPARAHGAGPGRGSVVLRRRVRRRAPRGCVAFWPRGGAVSSRAPCGSGSRRRSSRGSTASP